MPLDPLKLISGLPKDKLTKAIFLCLNGLEVYKRALGFYLLEFEKSLAGRGDGYKNVRQFLRTNAPECNIDECMETLRVARKLESLPKLDAAFREKRLSWSQIREIVRKATPDTEESWIKIAEGKSCAEVQRIVADTPEGEAPRETTGLGTPPATQNIHCKVSPVTYELFHTALAKTQQCTRPGTLRCVPCGRHAASPSKEHLTRTLSNTRLSVTFDESSR